MPCGRMPTLLLAREALLGSGRKNVTILTHLSHQEVELGIFRPRKIFLQTLGYSWLASPEVALLCRSSVSLSSL